MIEYFKYTNRKGEDHYFRAVETAKGKLRYYIVKNKAGYTNLIEEIPAGFEVVELPEEGRVIFRKRIPKKITEEEKRIVEDAVESYQLLMILSFLLKAIRLLSFIHSLIHWQGKKKTLLQKQPMNCFMERL